MGITIEKGKPWPNGVVCLENNVNMTFALLKRTQAHQSVYIKLFDLEKGTSEKYEIPDTWCFGNLYMVQIHGIDPVKHGYQIHDGDKVVEPQNYAETIEIKKNKIYLFETSTYDWEGDCPPKIPFNDMYLYKLHVKGFTQHKSSKVKHKGTFEGMIEKIPYLTALGINAVELMPVYDFDEQYSNGKIQWKNYWGYGQADFKQIKNSYAAAPDASGAFKTLVKALHRNKIEVIMEIYFTDHMSIEAMLSCLKYWAYEYHVDGFHVNRFPCFMEALLEDPFLSEIKIISDDFWEASKIDMGTLRRARYSEDYQNAMRCFLRGDDYATDGFMDHMISKSDQQTDIHFMASNNGFTLMDLVSYDSRHNELNGENNQDGTAMNYSWNCGIEGATRKKEVLKLRKRQLKNALILAIFHQGVPMIYAGDEFGNTQQGNNNAWCQDNEISWLDWKLADKNASMISFVKQLICLRKEEAIFHLERPFQMNSMTGIGLPEFSFHGKMPWKTDDASWDKCLGCMYVGAHHVWYFAYNMHNIDETFHLPNPPKGQIWSVYVDTAMEAAEESDAALNRLTLKAHSIVILKSK